MSIESYPSPNGVLTSLIWRKTAAGSETSLSGYDNASQALSYTPGQEQVYLNGILLVRGSDYTATNGTSITGLTALAVDDFVQINCYNNFSVASVPAASITGEVTNTQITSLATSKLTGTVANNQLANSSITINGSAVALGGSVSLPGDIESVTASTGLSGGGSTGALTLTNTMATAIDAKGDLVVGTAADTFSKLGVGANGTVLTAASGEATGLSWATPASGGGMTLINSGGTTLTGAAVTISSIPTTYRDLQIVVENFKPATDAKSLYMNVNGDTGANTHTWGYGTTASSAFDINSWSLSRYNDNSVSQGLSITTIYNYANTTTWKIGQCYSIANQATTTTSFNQIMSLGLYNGTAAVTSLRFFAEDGNMTSGTVYVYGVK